MERLTLTLTSDSGSFDVPYSTGYQTYGALLSLLDTVDAATATTIHDSPFASLTNSGLIGRFGYDTHRDYHKVVLPDEEYELVLGVTHPDDEDVFEALTKALVIQNQPLELAHGSLTVSTIETESATPAEIVEGAADTIDDGLAGVEMAFDTPTCLSRYDDVWEAHPDRVYLFQSLARRWNKVSSADAPIELTEQKIGEEVYVDPDEQSYDTHSIVVHREEPRGASTEDTASTEDGVTPDGGKHVNEAQGFTGTWAYRFKDATAATKTAVLALAQFAEYAGVGRHTARGAGTVTVTPLSQ